MSYVFHLLLILVKVVCPADISTILIVFSNCLSAISSTRKYAYDVISLVDSFYNFHTPSFWLSKVSTCKALHLGRILTSKPLILNSKLGLF